MNLSRIADRSAAISIQAPQSPLGGVLLVAAATLALSAPLCLYTGTSAWDYTVGSGVAGLSFGAANLIDQSWRLRQADIDRISWRESFVFGSHGFANAVHVTAYIKAMHTLMSSIFPEAVPQRETILGVLDVASMSLLYGFVFSLKSIIWQRVFGTTLGLSLGKTSLRQTLSKSAELTAKAWWWRASFMGYIIFAVPQDAAQERFHIVTVYMFLLSIYNSWQINGRKISASKNMP